MITSLKSTSFFKVILFTLPAWIVISLQRYHTDLFIGDDAYMTFKVARNLLSGLGFIYNEGEYVLGTTTTLWAAVVAGLSWIFKSDPITVFRPVGFIIDLLNFLLLLVIASSNGRYLLRGLMATLLFSLSWHMNYASIIGMETNFFMLLILLSAYLQQKDSFKFRTISIALASATFITRPEGVFLIVGIGLYRLINHRKMPWLEIITGSIIIIPYFIYMYIWFGTIIPHAGVAKSIAYYRQPFQAFNALKDHIGIFTLTPLFDYKGIAGKVLPYLAWGVWCIGIYKGSVNNISHALLGFCSLSIILLYSVMNPLIFEWYVVPLELSYSISLVWGFCAITKLLSNKFSSRIYYPILVISGITIITIGMLRYQVPTLAMEVVDHPGGYRNWPSLSRHKKGSLSARLPLLGPSNRENLYIELAALIEPEVTRDTVVIAPEYGAFGYHTSAKMLSSIGHNSIEMLEYLPAPKDQVSPYMNNAITQEMIDGFEPDYVLSLEAFIRKSLLKSPGFQKDYELVKKLDSKVFGSRGLYLFRRKKKE